MSTEQNTDKAGGLWSLNPAEREFASHFHECAICGKMGATRLVSGEWQHDTCKPQAQHSPLRDAIKRATRAFDGDSNDEEHDALLTLIESAEASVNDAAQLAEALYDAMNDISEAMIWIHSDALPLKKLAGIEAMLTRNREARINAVNMVIEQKMREAAQS